MSRRPQIQVEPAETYNFEPLPDVRIWRMDKAPEYVPRNPQFAWVAHIPNWQNLMGYTALWFVRYWAGCFREGDFFYSQ